LAGQYGYANSLPNLLKNISKLRKTKIDVDKQRKFVMISLVAVESNEVRPLNSTLALGFYHWVSTEGRAKWLFLLSFHSIRTPHDSSESAWTAWKKTPHTSTPLVQNVTSVDLATGKATGTSVVNKASCISEQIRQAHLGLFGFSMLIGVNE
jgi:hypothetical protein